MTDRQNTKKHNLPGIIGAVMLSIPVLMLLVIPLRGEKKVSDSENRELQSFPELTWNGFISGRFQDRLENALADQYPGSEAIKSTVVRVQNAVTSLEAGLLRALSGSPVDTYTEVTPGYYHFGGDEKRIVEKARSPEEVGPALRAAAEDLNTLRNVRRYVYFIQNSRTTDFSATEAENDRFWDLIREAYRADGYGRFVTAGYDGYCREFYSTDHHWNAAGADRGYREILRLLTGGEEEPLPHGEPVTYDVIFNGSYARQTRDLCSEERFTVYPYDIPALAIRLNGKKGQYGHRSLYEKQKYPTDELRNHYAYYYGGDYGEIRIENKNGNGRKLLVVADSYSNPVDLLLASHFSTTCVVDPRYYLADTGQELDLQKYVDENGIDTVLWMGDILFFSGTGEQEGAD